METMVVELPTTPADWAVFPGGDLDAKVREIEVAHRRVEASIVAATDHVERSAHFQRDGHRSPSSWLMATTNCTRGAATGRVRSARMLRELTAVAAEFCAGRVGVDQVREIARLAANPRAGDQVVGSEDILLEAAQSLEWADFRVVTKRWEQLADADGAHAEHEHAHEDRNARCEFDGAVFRFETAHGVIQGTSMRNVFDAFCEAEFDRDRQWANDTYGDDANASQYPRTAAQRRADAFVAMVLAAATAGVGDGKPIDTTVNLVCDLEQFERAAAESVVESAAPAESAESVVESAEPVVESAESAESAAPVEPVEPVGGESSDDGQVGGADDVGAIDPASVRERRCETTDGVPVDLRQMVAAALVGRVRSIVTDGAGVIISAGRKRKLFTGALRESIMAIDPVCGWLGCNLRAQIATIDHLEPRSRGGPTDARNSKIMCDHHNIFKHNAGYRVERQPDGTILITRPDGTPLRPPDAA